MSKIKNKNKGIRPAPSNTPRPSSQPTATVAQFKELGGLEAKVDELGPKEVTPLNTDGMGIESVLRRAGKAVAELEAHRDDVLSAKNTAVEARKEAESKAAELISTAQVRANELTSDAQDLKVSAESKAAELMTLEQDLNQRLEFVMVRETEADSGFQQMKSQTLNALENEIQSLRRSREDLQEEREILAANLARLEDEHQQKLADELEIFRERLRADSKAHQTRLLDEVNTHHRDMASEREESLSKLREEIESSRAAWNAERAESINQIETLAESLRKRELELKRLDSNLGLREEMLREDAEFLEDKVQQLAAQKIEVLNRKVEALENQLEGARQAFTSISAELDSVRALEQELKGKSAKELMDELKSLKKKNGELQKELNTRLDQAMADRLDELEGQRTDWLDKESGLKTELSALKSRVQTLQINAVELDGVRQEKEAIRVHKEALQVAVSELRTEVEDLKGKDALQNPFKALTKIDTDCSDTIATGPKPSSLKEFAEDLRHRIATGIKGRTLYYSEHDIRAFIGGLAMGRLMLLQGISGTGKTSLPKAFANAVGGHAEIVEVQAGWRDRQDLLGYYNAFHRKYYATEFLQALYKAGTPEFRDRPFIIILDEINLSRPEQFFADFLSTMEQPLNERRVTLMSDPVTDPPLLFHEQRHLPVPPNVWFVGTANHDESTVEFADKTYDRAHVMEMPRNTADARFPVEQKKHRAPIRYVDLQELFEAASEKHLKEVEAGLEWLNNGKVTGFITDRFRLGWGNRIENQMKLFVPAVIESGGTLSEAMDHLVSTKIIRKLRDRHDVRAQSLEELRDLFEAHWFKEKPETKSTARKCVEMIDLEIKAKRMDEEA